MQQDGGCRCGAVRYRIDGEPAHHAVCHCRDCQRASGAPAIAWLAVPTAAFHLTKGVPVSYTSEAGSTRHFCGQCGTPLFFVNEANLPGIVDIQSVTLDAPDCHAPGVQIQTAERRSWMLELDTMPQFERFPGETG